MVSPSVHTPTAQPIGRSLRAAQGLKGSPGPQVSLRLVTLCAHKLHTSNTPRERGGRVGVREAVTTWKQSAVARERNAPRVSPTLLPQPLPRALPAHGSPALQTQTDSFKKPGQRGSGAPGGAGARHPLRDRLLLPQAGTGLPSLLPDPRAGIRTAANLGEGCVMANDDLSVSPISKDGGWGKRDEAGKETRDADPNPRSSPSSRRLLHTTSPTHR